MSNIIYTLEYTHGYGVNSLRFTTFNAATSYFKKHEEIGICWISKWKKVKGFYEESQKVCYMRKR